MGLILGLPNHKVGVNTVLVSNETEKGTRYSVQTEAFPGAQPRPLQNMKQLAKGFMKEIENELNDIAELIDTLLFKIRDTRLYVTPSKEVAVKF